MRNRLLFEEGETEVAITPFYRVFVKWPATFQCGLSLYDLRGGSGRSISRRKYYRVELEARTLFKLWAYFSMVLCGSRQWLDGPQTEILRLEIYA